MSHWWGSKADSEAQKAERDARGVRRFIRSLPAAALNDSVASVDEFHDCDPVPNLDGNDDMPDNAAVAAAALAAEQALPFDRRDLPDDADAWKKTLTLKFDRNDPEFWFSEIEHTMKTYGINRQRSKRSALMGKDILPEDVIEELKPLLRIPEDEADKRIYKLIKTELLNIFGKKDQQALAKAASRRLTTRPSALGKALIHDICPGTKPFVDCHCAKVVWYFFDLQMPQVIKTALAKERFNGTTYKAIFQHADDVFDANRLGAASSSASVVAAVSASQDLNETQPALQYPVAAASFRGGARGRGRGGNNRGKPQQPSKGEAPKPSPDSSLPPNLCMMHKKYKKEAFHCRNPFVCEWAKFIKPKPVSNSNTN